MVKLCYPLSAVRFPREREMVRPDSSDLSSGLRPAPFRSGTKEGALSVQYMRAD